MDNHYIEFYACVICGKKFETPQPIGLCPQCEEDTRPDDYDYHPQQGETVIVGGEK